MLHELIDQWLRGSWRGLGLRFPAPLEFRYEADTRHERSQSLAIFAAIGFFTAFLLYPSLCATLPDVTLRWGFVYLDICIPAGFACAAVMLLDPSPFVREALMAAVVTVSSLCVVFFFYASRTADVPVLVAVALLLLIYIALGIQLRFAHAAWSAASIALAFGFTLPPPPQLSGSARETLLLLTAIGIAYLLLANWRLERQFRRNYLVSLREQLQRQDLAQRNQELDELSRRDPLTGLANRRAYDLWLARAWDHATQTGDELGLIIIDIDRFKLFNDYYGHAAGDACLQKIARSLGEQLRGTSDLVARLGGEEFAVLLPRLTEDVCADVAERLRLAVQALELPHMGLGQDGMVSVSAGVASRWAGEAATPSKLFAAADAALYQAKAAGRNRVCVGAERTG